MHLKCTSVIHVKRRARYSQSLELIQTQSFGIRTEVQRDRIKKKKSSLKARAAHHIYTHSVLQSTPERPHENIKIKIFFTNLSEQIKNEITIQKPVWLCQLCQAQF